MSSVVVLGCGSIGLPLAVALAGHGGEVLGVDIDPARVALLAAGGSGMQDAGLDAALRDAAAAGRLRFAARLDPSPAPRGYVVAVPTAADAAGRLIVGPLDAALAMIAAVAHPGELVVLRSTVPIGTLRRAADRLPALLLAACPDRSIAGRGFAEQSTVPNVIGGLTPAADAAARRLLAPLAPMRSVSSPEAAEAIKLFANAWRDATFALANQFALIAEAAGLDLTELRSAGAAGFPRFDLPRPGPVGGPCLAKDGRMLQAGAAERGVAPALLAAARDLNDGLAGGIARQIAAEAGGLPPPTTIAVLGLAFKGTPPTLDRRGSFGVALAERLAALGTGAALRCWDPAAEPDAGEAAVAVAGAQIVVLANDHPRLAAPRLYEAMAPGALIYDACGVLADIAGLRADLRVRRFGTGMEIRR